METRPELKWNNTLKSPHQAVMMKGAFLHTDFCLSKEFLLVKKEKEKEKLLSILVPVALLRYYSMLILLCIKKN